MSESRSMQRRKAAQKGEPMPTFSPEPAYTEQDLREAKSFFSFGSSRTCLHCGYDSVATDVSEKELAAEFSRIRSEARAGMREACAKHRPFWQGLALVCSCGKWTYKSYADKEGTQVQAQWEAHILSLPDLAADEAIERVKSEAEKRGYERGQREMAAQRTTSQPLADVTAAAKETRQ